MLSFHTQLCGLRGIRSVSGASGGVCGKTFMCQQKTGVPVTTVGEDTKKQFVGVVPIWGENREENRSDV